MPEAAAQSTLVNRPLASRVAAELETLALQLGRDDPLARAVDAALSTLRGPLRVAVAGRISKGKSTLVNALLGQALATTGAAETTVVVASYRGGPRLAGEILLRSGARLPLPMPGGRLPETLGVDLASVGMLHVTVPDCEFLRDLTVIDTPGIAGLDDSAGTRTTELLGIATRDTRSVVHGAEAMLFLLDREDATSVDMIEQFGELARLSWARCVNVVGVLTRIDTFSGAETDPWEAGCAIADRLAGHAALRGRVTTVVPLIGKLAETALTGVVDDVDADNVARLACLSPAKQRLLLSSGDRLVASSRTTDSGVDQTGRRRCLELFGLWGLQQLVREGAGVAVTVQWLEQRCRELSGIDALVDQLRTGLARQADAIKSQAALAGVGRAAARTDATGQRLYADLVERLLSGWEMHSLREIEALGEHASERIALPAGLAAELERVVGGTSLGAKVGVEAGARPEVVQSAATEGIVRMQRLVNSPLHDEDVKRVADVVRRSYIRVHRLVDAELTR